MTDTGLVDFLARVRHDVDAELAVRLAGSDVLHEGMRYAVLGGGKRLRPALTLAAAEAMGGTWEAAMPAALAVELLHAYTLVHDDLPAMDDDELRRGNPTVHVAFGEANAILIGDALLTEAFGALAELGPRAAEATKVLCRRAGAAELLAGQVRDLSGEPIRSIEELEDLHAKKTGALFAAATELGGVSCGANDETRHALAQYGLALGIAFQHSDDLQDGDHALFAGEARRHVGELLALAKRSISGHLLHEIADSLAART